MFSLSIAILYSMSNSMQIEICCDVEQKVFIQNSNHLIDFKNEIKSITIVNRRKFNREAFFPFRH